MIVLSRAATRTARAAPRCASALADAAWLRSRALRRTFATSAIASSAAPAPAPEPATQYTSYTLPKGGALPVTAPRNTDPTPGKTSITLEAPRRAPPNARASVETDVPAGLARESYPSQPTPPQQQPQPQAQQQPQVQQQQAQTQQPQPSQQPQKQSRPRRTLRPRKAAVTLTPAAVAQLGALLDDPEPRMIRIGVRNKGCSGLAYHLEYVTERERGPLDEEVVQDGVKVLVEGRALMSVIGSEMDWVEDRLSARFVFRNPNISEFTHLWCVVGDGVVRIWKSNANQDGTEETCGCGESFMV